MISVMIKILNHHKIYVCNVELLMRNRSGHDEPVFQIKIIYYRSFNLQTDKVGKANSHFLQQIQTKLTRNFVKLEYERYYCRQMTIFHFSANRFC